jgi:regulator of protease activity HflC (stomatin/prohibitin superfamily)
MLRTYYIQNHEFGLHFRNDDVMDVLRPGRHFLFDPMMRHTVHVVSQRDVWLIHPKLDMIVRTGVLQDIATVIDLKDDQRAIVWVDGRFSRILKPGLYAHWNGFHDVRVEVVNVRDVRFEHPQMHLIAQSAQANELLDICQVNRDCEGVLFIDGRFVETLDPGRYAFWRCGLTAKVVEVDLRETSIDISGQDIMTADKVTLRLNAIVTMQVVDSKKAVSSSTDSKQSLYREAQLALRTVIGSRVLDDLLGDKESVTQQVEQLIRERATTLGLEIRSVGIRDVILPGDMKDLMNKVTEARKAAEANLIARREETAAMRSQSNTAKLLNDNPALMRMRELEALERIAATGNMKVVLGEKGLADRVTNLL